MSTITQILTDATVLWVAISALFVVILGYWLGKRMLEKMDDSGRRLNQADERLHDRWSK